MARIGVRTTLAKYLEFPNIVQSTSEYNSAKSEIIRKCLISCLFSQEVCIMYKSVYFSRFINLSWYPIKWPSYEIISNQTGLQYGYDTYCIVSRKNNEIKISTRTCIICINRYNTTCENPRIAEHFSKYTDDLFNAKDDEFPYLAFRIYEQIKNKI
jgi:hypothetical protein